MNAEARSHLARGKRYDHRDEAGRQRRHETPSGRRGASIYEAAHLGT